MTKRHEAEKRERRENKKKKKNVFSSLGQPKQAYLLKFLLLVGLLVLSYYSKAEKNKTQTRLKVAYIA